MRGMPAAEALEPSDPADDPPPESRQGAEEEDMAHRRPLRHGTCPGNLGAHWSEYYEANARTPEVTTMAPWVAHLYARRQRRHESKAAAAAAAALE